MELTGLIEIDDVDAGIRVLEAAQILHVATQADVVVEVPHHTGAEIPAEHVVRRADVGQRTGQRQSEHGIWSGKRDFCSGYVMASLLTGCKQRLERDP